MNEDLEKKLQDYSNELDQVIIDLYEEIEDLECALILESYPTLENNAKEIQRIVQILVNRLSLAELLTISNDLRGLIK